MAAFPRFRATEEMVVQDVERDTLVYQRQRKRLVVLNRSAAEILRMCDGRHGELDIVRTLAERFPGAPEDEVTEDVRRTVEELIELGLVAQH